MNNQRQLTFWIPGAIAPKARPRVTVNGTYFPLKYKQWRKDTEKLMIAGLSKKHIPIARAAINIKLQGAMRGDCDNIAGAILDALVSAKVLLDDRISCVPALLIEHSPDGEKGALVEVNEMPVEVKIEKSRKTATATQSHLKCQVE